MGLREFHPDHMSFTLKIFIGFGLVALVPLVLLGFLAFKNFERIEAKSVREIMEKGEKSISFASEIGDYAIEHASAALDQKVIESVETRALDLSYRIADFLYERDNDIRILSRIEPGRNEYLMAYKNLTREIIVPVEKKQKNNSITWEHPDNRKGWRHQPPFDFYKERIPLYRELTFVSVEGKEVIKIKDGEISKDLRDISQKENTYCKAEDYFSSMDELKKGEIYVSRVVGAYVKGWLVKKGDKIVVKEGSAYAGKENPTGKKFKGIIRYATPVFKNNKKTGYITLALDHTHIMEFTDHLVPTGERYHAISDAGGGDYAWMWDYEGRCISHPRDFFITGFDPETGEEVPGWVSQERYNMFKKSGLKLNDFLNGIPKYNGFSLRKKGASEQVLEGKIPLDCRYLDHAPQCQGWRRNTMDGGTGSFIIFWSGLWKLTAESAIPYYTGQYGKSKVGFGFVTFGADISTFHKEAVETGKEIKKTINRVNIKIDEDIESAKFLLEGYISTYKNFFKLIFFLTLAMASILSLRTSKRIVDPVNEMKKVLNFIRLGDFSKRVKVEFRDELGELGTSFNKMADALKASEARQKKYLLRERSANKKLGEAIKKRVDAEKLLIENQKNLESIVSERTISLKKANESLVTTIRELNFRRRAAMILANMSEDLQKCSEKADAYKIAGEACSKLFSDFSGAILSYDDTKGYLKPLFQWNSKGILHGALPVKDCPAMLYRACIKSLDDKVSVCKHIDRHHSRVFYCASISNMEENIGVISLNTMVDKKEFSGRKWQETEMTLSSVVEYFKASYMNISLKDKLKKESISDPLTGLFNRRYMETTLNREISRARRYGFYLGVIMLDVDHFKNFNDTYGHETGDRVLKAIGNWLGKNTRKEDVVCRYGGEEFIIILPGIDSLNLEKRGESIRKGLGNNINIKYGSERLKVTVSIGCSCEKGLNIDEDIVGNADKALYSAKKLGRNRVEFFNKENSA